MRRKTKVSSSNPETIIFNKADFVDKELIDEISLWMLRAILKSGGHKEFIDNNKRFHNDDICYFLNLDKYVNMDSDDYSRSEVINILKLNLLKLEKRKRFTSSKILTKNINQLISLMDLNQYEAKIIEFLILVKQYEILDNTMDLIGSSLNSTQVKRAISTILDIPQKEVNNAFASNSKFSKSSLLTMDKRNLYTLNSKVEFISDEFVDNMLNLDEDIKVMIKDSVRECTKAELTLHDFSHISKDVEILVPYIQSAIKSKQKGVNILFYGLPGTGKTELTKTIAHELKTNLYEISYSDMDDEALDGKKRLKAYKTAQALLVNQDTILMYDEAEDIFESNSGGFFAPPSRQKDKAWINRVLESNTIPTIWITNNIDAIDNAIIRRFDMSIELPIPTKKRREEIFREYSKNILDEQSIKLLAQNEDIAPAFISRASKVINTIETDKKEEVFTQILNNTLKAQGYKEIKQSNTNSLPAVYNPEFINTTTDLNELTLGIKESQNARLCLYGPAGTGKSAFGKYISESLDKPLHVKKGSDLISKWVGGTEQNIARAFEEAKEENAVLIFDEVDSFLADRTNAKASWEVTQVNEMLVQMENFDGIFIATTNLMDNLDRASLRRFDLKLEFDYLRGAQAWDMFLSFSKELNLKKPSIAFKRGIENLRYLTPGDFAAVTRQHRFRPIKSTNDLISRLVDEVEVKNASVGKVMGFM